jgi:hypothetical protein
MYKTSSEKFYQFVNGAIGLAGGLLVIGGIGLIVWQIYFYLKWDVWTSLSLIDGLAYFDYVWARNPTEWYGLHALLDKAPLSMLIIVLGIWVVVYASSD